MKNKHKLIVAMSIFVVITNIITVVSGNVIFAVAGIVAAAASIFFVIKLKNDLLKINESYEKLQICVNDTLNEIKTIGYKSVHGNLKIRGELKHGGEFDNAIIAVNEVIAAMQTCYDNMRHPMQILDKDIRCVHINPTIISYGYNESDIGKTMAQMYSQELHNNYIECYKEIDRTRSPYLMRTETPTSQGLVIEENYIWPIF